jgi:hypothetical protein
MRKRILLIAVGIVMIVAMTWAVYWIVYGIYKGGQVRHMNELRVQQREDKFKNNPNLLDCLVLLNNYYWDFRQYEKALYYGERCIKLDVDSTRRGWYVHMILADIHAKRNKNMEEACYHIRLGLEKAKRDNIPERNIDELKIQDLIDTCKANEKASGGSQEGLP